MNVADISVFRQETNRPSLPTENRAILDENMTALYFRWQLANGSVPLSRSIMNRWFPGQDYLFKILSVVSKEKVAEMSDTINPLFTVRLPTAYIDIEPAGSQILAFTLKGKQVEGDEVERQCRTELFYALLGRLDAIRIMPEKASIIYDMNQMQISQITRHAPAELNKFSDDPMVALVPLVTDDYFSITAMNKTTMHERRVLSATSRQARSVHAA